MTNYQALNQHFVVKLDRTEKKTTSGIVVPDSAKGKTSAVETEFHEVLSICPKSSEMLDVKAGDFVRVLARESMGVIFLLEGVEYVEMSCFDISGKKTV